MKRVERSECSAPAGRRRTGDGSTAGGVEHGCSGPGVAAGWERRREALWRMAGARWVVPVVLGTVLAWGCPALVTGELVPHAVADDDDDEDSAKEKRRKKRRERRKKKKEREKKEREKKEREKKAEKDAAAAEAMSEDAENAAESDDADDASDSAGDVDAAAAQKATSKAKTQPARSSDASDSALGTEMVGAERYDVFFIEGSLGVHGGAPTSDISLSVLVPFLDLRLLMGDAIEAQVTWGAVMVDAVGTADVATTVYTGNPWVRLSWVDRWADRVRARIGVGGTAPGAFFRPSEPNLLAPTDGAARSDVLAYDAAMGARGGEAPWHWMPEIITAGVPVELVVELPWQLELELDVDNVVLIPVFDSEADLGFATHFGLGVRWRWHAVSAALRTTGFVEYLSDLSFDDRSVFALHLESTVDLTADAFMRFAGAFPFDDPPRHALLTESPDSSSSAGYWGLSVGVGGRF